MSLRIPLFLIVFGNLFVTLDALAEDRPAQQEKTRIREATAAQLKDVKEAIARKRIYYQLRFDPFTKRPIHSFEVRFKVDHFPVIPFPYELCIRPPLDDPRSCVGLDAYDSTRPISGVCLRLDTTSPDMDWKKLRGVSSLSFDYGSRCDIRGLLRLDSLTTLIGPFDDSDLKELKKLKHLKNLFTTTGVTDAGLKELGEYPALEHLILADGSKITQEGMRHLQGAKKLTQLGIERASRLDTRAVGEIAKLTRLTHLELKNLSSSIDLFPLGDLESLAALELRGFRLRGNQTIPFEKCKSLQTLVLDGSGVDSYWIKEISKIDSLKSLTLEKTPLTDKELEPLHTLQLHTLILSGPSLAREARLSGVGLAQIVKGMKSLTVLGVEGMRLFPMETSPREDSPFGGPDKIGKAKPSEADRKKRAEIVAAFKSLTQLRCLDLIRTGVTEEEVDWLKDLKGLQYLYLDGKAHRAVAGKLRTALPGCTIELSSSRPAQLGMEPAK